MRHISVHGSDQHHTWWCLVIDIISLGPSDVIWRQGSRSTLAQVMACCLMASSHYLNQCWLMISDVLWHSPDSNSTENVKIFIVEMNFKFTNLRLYWNLPGTNQLMIAIYILCSRNLYLAVIVCLWRHPRVLSPFRHPSGLNGIPQQLLETDKQRMGHISHGFMCS